MTYLYGKSDLGKKVCELGPDKPDKHMPISFVMMSVNRVWTADAGIQMERHRDQQEEDCNALSGHSMLGFFIQVNEIYWRLYVHLSSRMQMVRGSSQLNLL